MLEFSVINIIAIHKLSTVIGPGGANWGRWVKANLIGGTIGWAIVAFSMMGTLGLSLFACWLIVGPYVAGAQYVVISEYIDSFPLWKKSSIRAATWITSATLGMLIAITCCWGMPGLALHKLARIYIELGLSEDTREFISTSLAFAFGGLMYGAIQGLTLKNLRAVAIWCAVSTLGWGIGATLGTQTAQVVMNLLRGGQFQLASGYVLGPFDALYFALAGITGTFIFGLITGIFVSRLPSQPRDIPGKLQTEQNDPA